METLRLKRYGRLELIWNGKQAQAHLQGQGAQDLQVCASGSGCAWLHGRAVSPGCGKPQNRKLMVTGIRGDTSGDEVLPGARSKVQTYPGLQGLFISTTSHLL